MSVQLNKAASFFGKQDVAIEVLSFLDPRSMACAFAVCKDFQGVKHEVFAVFLRTCSELVALNECARLSTESLKKVADWGSLCNRMERRFSVEMDLTSGKLSPVEPQFISFLSSSNLGQLRRLSVLDASRFRTVLPPGINIQDCSDNIPAALLVFGKKFSIIRNPELLALAKAAPYLEHLELEDCDAVTVRGIACLQNLKLRTLSIVNCDLVTDGIAEVLAGMKSLTELDLSYCEKVTEYAVERLLQTLKNLRKIDISSTPGRGSSRKVKALKDHGQQLAHIGMDFLDCFVPDVTAMVKSFKNLVFLSLGDCRLSFARKLQATNPNLTLRILKSEVSQFYTNLVSSGGHPRTGRGHQKPDEIWEIVKPLPRETTVEEYANIMLRYSGPRTSFRHVWGDWKFHGENSNRSLMFAATTESLVDNFKLRGHPDGTVSAWIGFNPKVFKSHLADLGLKVVSQFDSAFKTTTKDELRQAIEILFRIGEMPEPYLSQIEAIVKGSNS